MFEKFLEKNKSDKKPVLSGAEGFTLIELILYLALAGFIIYTTGMFLANILQARVKNQTIATVNQEGNQAMSLITQTLRNATAINSPATGATGSMLSVNTPVSANNPTVFSLSGGVITMQEGSNPAVALTSNLVVISNLQFRNLSRPSTPGNVDVTFNVAHIH